ncbi:hypothetical protein IWW35_006136, partial [Coemansia sp. RSA 1878]
MSPQKLVFSPGCAGLFVRYCNGAHAAVSIVPIALGFCGWEPRTGLSAQLQCFCWPEPPTTVA